MAGTTPVYAFPYPSLSDPPNGAAQMQSLATAVENKIVTLDAALTAINSNSSPYSKGYVGGVTSIVDTNVTTTEAIIDSCTFTAVSGRRYEIIQDCEYYQKTGTAATNMQMHTRVIAGGTPTATGGTVQGSKYPNCGPAAFITYPSTVVSYFVAPSSGTFAVSFTAKVDSGTGGIAGGAAAHIHTLTVKDVGV
jgi:hypothetical protein